MTDTVGDIKEAHEVGVRVIAVDYGFHERERLAKAKPFRIVSHFSEIKPIVERL